MKIFAKLFGLLLLLLIVSPFSLNYQVAKVDAGVSEISVNDPSSLNGASGLPGNIWYFDRRDASGTSVSDNIINFDATKSNSFFNLRRKVQNVTECGISEVLRLSMKVRLDNLPQSVKFYFALGLSKLSSTPTEGGTILYFESVNGNVGYGMLNYSSSGTASKLAFTRIDNFSSGRWIDVSFNIDSEGTLFGEIDDNKFTVPDCPKEGYIGFGQITDGSSRVNVKIKELLITSFINDTPENSNFFEDFNYNCFNSSAFTMQSKASGLKDSKLSVENGRLNFVNTGSAFIATKLRYSNLDLYFDLVDVVKKTEYDNDGNITTVKSGSFGVVFGLDLNNYMERKGKLSVEFSPVWGIKPLTELIVKSNRSILTRLTLPEKFNVFCKDDIFGIKISMQNGVLMVCMKNSNENGFTEVLNYNHGITPLGYCEIAALGAMDYTVQKNLTADQMMVGSFSIDNLSIVNKDFGKLIKLVDYISNKEAIAKDYEYVNDWDSRDLLQSTIV